MTRNEAIALAAAGADQVKQAVAWFEANEPSRRKTRLHRHTSILAAEWEEEVEVPYGTFGGDDGGDQKTPPPP